MSWTSHRGLARLEAETRAGRPGRLADFTMRLDFLVLDELGYLPFAQAGGNCCST
jgi:DNA replication protein DnaC